MEDDTIIIIIIKFFTRRLLATRYCALLLLPLLYTLNYALLPVGEGASNTIRVVVVSC